MVRDSFAAWLVVLGVAVACSGSSDKSDEDGGGGTGAAGAPAPQQTDLTDGTVGSSCAGTCQGDLQCAAGGEVPNGYCTKACGSHPECGPEGRCVQSSSQAVCLRACANDHECRPGYHCANAGEFGVCDVGTPAPPPGTGGAGGAPQPSDCSAVALPAQVSGGCSIRLVTPSNCELIDLRGGKSYEFAWTTDTTMCETPFQLIVAGNPPTQDNALTWNFSDGSNNGLVGKNTGGLTWITAADLARLRSDNGIYHWVVAGWYGSHPDSQTFRVQF